MLGQNFNIQLKIEVITKCVRGAGLKVNRRKTELCLFFNRDYDLIKLTINGLIIKSVTQ